MADLEALANEYLVTVDGKTAEEPCGAWCGDGDVTNWVTVVRRIRRDLTRLITANKGLKFPQELVTVLTRREIANQEIQTFAKQQEAEERRIEMEQARGTADMQSQLAQSSVGVEIQRNRALARKADADGEATYIRETGTAKGAEVEAVGMARAKGYEAQVAALGQVPTALVNSVSALAEERVSIVPEILVAGGNGSGPIDGLASTLMKYLTDSPKGDAPTGPSGR